MTLELSCDVVCRSISELPSIIFKKHGVSLESYEKVASIMNEFLETAEDTILKMDTKDKERVRLQLKSSKEDQLVVQRLLKACFLADISFSEFVELYLEKQVPNDYAEKIYVANVLLKQPNEEVISVNNIKDLMSVMTCRLNSSNFKNKIAPLEDIHGNIYVLQLKINSLIEAIKPLTK